MPRPWDQPMCLECWDARYPDRVPTRLKDAKAEVCSYCGGPTMSRIFVRQDPLTVPYPPASVRDDD